MTQEEKHNFYLQFDRFQKSREKNFAPQLNAALKLQYKQFTQHISLGLEPALLKIDSENISKIIRSLYIDAGTVYGNYVRLFLQKQKARMPMGFSEEMRQLIIQYFSIDILNSSEGITQKTRELIREVFTTYYQLGKGIDEIVKALENTELSEARARTIARTETVTAANKGAMFVAKKTGIKMNKEWLSAQDNRVRRHHEDVNGQLVPFDEYFTVGGFKLSQPGDRGGTDGRLATDPKEIVNCRCCVLPIPIEQNGKLVMV